MARHKVEVVIMDAQLIKPGDIIFVDGYDSPSGTLVTDVRHEHHWHEGPIIQFRGICAYNHFTSTFETPRYVSRTVRLGDTVAKRTR